MAANTRVDYPRNVFSFSELCLIWIVFAIAAGDADLREIPWFINNIWIFAILKFFP